MSTKDDQQLDDLNDQQVEEVVDEVQDDQDSAKRGVYGWVISGSVHLAAIMLAMFAVFAQKLKQEVDTPPTRVNVIAPPEKEKEKPKEKRELEAKVELDAPTEAETPSPTNTLDVPPEPTEREADSDNPNPKGREEATAESETGGSGAFMAIGAGGGGAGMFGSRSGGGRKRAVGAGGGSKGSEGAVEASLRWFKRHQSPNGSWETDTYYQNCTEGAKCEPGGDKAGHGSDQNVAMTGYAVLCFLGAGYDHKTPNKYKTTVKKGLDWMLSVQKPTGYLGNRNYEHPVATMALAEAYAMTADPDLRGPAQKAIDQVLSHQNQDKAAGKDAYAGGLGWDYTAPTARNDSSVTGWNIMALKSALAGGLNVGKGMEGAKKWLELSWKASNAAKNGEYKEWKDITAYDKSHFAYCWNTDEPVAKDNPTGRESIGLVSAIFLGHTAGDAMVESLANEVMALQVPKAFPTNTYYMYYNTMAIFQMGGERWKKWNETVRDQLVHAQLKTTDCRDGSWDWQGSQFHGSDLGRVLTTAYNTLSLEVYYRYKQVQDLHAK